MVGQQFQVSFLSPSFKLYVVAPASVLPISDLGTLFYTSGRTQKSGGRPAIVDFIFEPLLQALCCDSCFRVARFQPWGLVLHIWEDTKKWWSARKFQLHFLGWLAGHGRWLAGHGGWLAGHLAENHLAGQLSAFQLSTAVRIFLQISPPSGGYFGRESLDALPSPFTPCFAYLKEPKAPLPRLQKFLSRTPLPNP